MATLRGPTSGAGAAAAGADAGAAGAAGAASSFLPQAAKTEVTASASRSFFMDSSFEIPEVVLRRFENVRKIILRANYSKFDAAPHQCIGVFTVEMWVFGAFGWRSARKVPIALWAWQAACPLAVCVQAQNLTL